MRILWITNIMLPPITEDLGMIAPPVGGWMISSLRSLVRIHSLEFAVATVWAENQFLERQIDGVKYYLLPLNGKSMFKLHLELGVYWKKIQKEFKPDVIHIHGTECAHGLSYIRSCGAKGVVISIQGLVSVCYRYFLEGITYSEVLKSMTLRDIVKNDNLFQQQKSFYKSGLIEKESIRSVRHIIGRTSWDRAHVLAINPNVEYHFCNETLRDSFYRHQWKYELCDKHSLFISQGNYPIKGLHQLIRALPYVLKSFPDTKLYVGGQNIRLNRNLSECIKRTGYGQYINGLIKKYSLNNCIVFTGFLNEEEMCRQYLKCNIFISPSSIENSPNSLGEAQLLGCPIIASYVGGVPDMMQGYVRGRMYRFEEIEMLASAICEYFEETWQKNNSLQDNQAVLERHNVENNAKTLFSIYEAIS